MRVHLARLGIARLQDSPVETVERLARLDRFGVHGVSDDPESADLILFTQCHMLPTDWRLTTVRDHPLTRHHRDRVMVYDERDRPWCGFPGLYVSMPARGLKRQYQRAWGYFPTPARPPAREPDLLFSFIGSPSARCRNELFDLTHPDAIVDEVRGFTFFDPSSVDFEQRRTRFQEVLGRSRFVLCPRGRGTSSIRLYETLAAGRVPVIVSDGWVPPPGPEWSAFSIRWPEGSTNGLVETLEDRVDDWVAMSTAASAAHAEFFSPEVWFHRAIELCAELRDSGLTTRFPRAGVRDRTFVTTGADVARWRLAAAARRDVKRVAGHSR